MSPHNTLDERARRGRHSIEAVVADRPIPTPADRTGPAAVTRVALLTLAVVLAGGAWYLIESTGGDGAAGTIEAGPVAAADEFYVIDPAPPETAATAMTAELVAEARWFGGVVDVYGRPDLDDPLADGYAVVFSSRAGRSADGDEVDTEFDRTPERLTIGGIAVEFGTNDGSPMARWADGDQIVRAFSGGPGAGPALTEAVVRSRLVDAEPLPRKLEPIVEGYTTDTTITAGLGNGTFYWNERPLSGAPGSGDDWWTVFVARGELTDTDDIVARVVDELPQPDEVPPLIQTETRRYAGGQAQVAWTATQNRVTAEIDGRPITLLATGNFDGPDMIDDLLALLADVRPATDDEVAALVAAASDEATIDG